MMRFLFKPSVSYALVANILMSTALASLGHWVAWIVFAVVSSIFGATIETIVMKDAK